MKILKYLENVKLVIINLKIKLQKEAINLPTWYEKHKGKIIPLNSVYDKRLTLMKENNSIEN